jgi:hypothetical protein
MHALRLCLIGLMTTASGVADAQLKSAPKPANTIETRYFTSVDGLMDGNADVILKETRQGKTVTAATLDVCYPADRGSARKDRFVTTLAINGTMLTGTTTSEADKLPVSVKLNRRPTGETFEFKGQITVGQTTTEVTSTDNTDLSEAEFRDSQSSDDTIAVAPKDFTEVSPESIAVKIKLDTASDFLRSLRGQNVEVALSSLNVACDALRAGQQTIYLTVDPDKAAAFVAKAKTAPGVVAAGWSTGLVEMDRAVRFSAAEWRDGDALNRDKLATAIGNVLATSLSTKLISSHWSDSSGKLLLTFKRPSQVFPALELTETTEVTALVAPDKPGATDKLMLWVSGPVTTTSDDSSGAKLTFSAAESFSEEDSDPKSDLATVAMLAKAFNGQRWDADKAVWK